MRGASHALQRRPVPNCGVAMTLSAEDIEQTSSYLKIFSRELQLFPSYLSEMVDESREQNVYMAKIAEQAERYDEMVESMKQVARLDVELTVEERNLLSVAYKNVIGARRASWRIVSSIEQKEETKGNEGHVTKIKVLSPSPPPLYFSLIIFPQEYCVQVQTELTNICNDILNILDRHLIPSATTGESKVQCSLAFFPLRVLSLFAAADAISFQVFYFKMKGDYWRYLAEFAIGNPLFPLPPPLLHSYRPGSGRKEAAEHSLTSYKSAQDIALTDLQPTHPIRLGLALNFRFTLHHVILHHRIAQCLTPFSPPPFAPFSSVFFYEILNSPDRACHLAKQVRLFTNSLRLLQTFPFASL